MHKKHLRPLVLLMLPLVMVSYLNCSKFNSTAPITSGVSLSSVGTSPVVSTPAPSGGTGVSSTNVPGRDGVPDGWAQYTFSPGQGHDEFTGEKYSWMSGMTSYANAMGVNWTYSLNYAPMNTPENEQWCAYMWLYQADGNAGGIMSQGAPYGKTATIPVQGFTMWTMDQKMTFNTIPSGDYDYVFKKMLNDYNMAGFKIVHFRPQYEFNLGSDTQTGTPNQPSLFASTGTYDPASGTGGTPSPFVMAWQHIVTIMRAQAAANGQKIYFHWNPAENQYNGFDMRKAYPGNDYVDYIGLDIYDGFWATGWTVNKAGATTALPVKWPGYASLAVGSTAQLAGGTWAANKDALSPLSMEAWANDINNEYHIWDYPGGTQYVATGQSGTWTTGMMTMIEFAQQMGRPMSFPETGLGLEYSAQGVAGGLAGGNPGQWFNNGGGVSPWNQNGTNFPGYLKSRIAYIQSLGLDVVFIANFVADYGYKTGTYDWLGWAPAVGDSYKKAFGATYPTPQ